MYDRKARIVFVISSLLISSSLFHSQQVLAAYNFLKYENNPIYANSTSNWDTISAHSPSVVKDPVDYKMWYEGNGGGGWRIGYAHSLDGISNWIRNPQPIIAIGSKDGFEMDTLNPNVIYNPDLNIYQMWYSSYSSNWQSGPDRFRLRYATSIDGENWNRYDDFVLKGSSIPTDWDSGGVARGVSVIYKDNSYHMWYTGTDWGTNWKIGYAKSPDGIHWTKQNNGMPVIFPTNSYELIKTNFPNVRYEDGMFKMIYGGSPGDLPIVFASAKSTDGIIWEKPINDNPILSIGNTGEFDSIILSGPSIQRIDENTIYLWYGGNAQSIGLAIGTDVIHVSPTPTNTLTPTQTPSPSPTPTPTPIPVQTKKIIIIPGMGGSWNREALTSCTKNPINDNWIQTFNYYSALRDRLHADGLTPLIFAYDWRKPVPENGLKLKQFIDSQTVQGEKVFVVGHSMGGLVARSYLEHEQTSNKIEKLLTAGSPHAGANIAYWAVEGDALKSADLGTKLAFSLTQYICQNKKNIPYHQTVKTMIPSFLNLLPIYQYLIDYKTNVPIPVSSMVFQNTWLPTTRFQYPFFGTYIGALSGTGFKTDEKYLVELPSGNKKSLSQWADGKPKITLTSDAGDKTVLNISSYIPGAQNWTIGTTHGGLVTDPVGIQNISEFFTPAIQGLGPKFLSNQESDSKYEKKKDGSENSALVFVSESGSFTVKPPKHSTVSDSSGLILLENPIEGKYELHITPEKDKTTIYVGQMLDEDKTIWKDYVLKKKTKITIPIDFDRSHPHDDPFEDSR